MKIMMSQWHRTTGFWVMTTPLLLIVFLGTQMATRQVSRRFETYRAIPEITHLATLTRLPPTQLIMLRGRISPASCQVSACDTDPTTDDLIIYREGPAEGRELRFRESFGQHFSSMVLDLPDGSVHISPSLTRTHILQAVRHTVTDGDRQRHGFRLGDEVTVQGQWQPTSTQPPILSEVTGVTGLAKTELLQDWQSALRKVRWASLVSGLLTGFGALTVATRTVRQRASRSHGERLTWHLQTATNQIRTSRT